MSTSSVIAVAPLVALAVLFCCSPGARAFVRRAGSALTAAERDHRVLSMAFLVIVTLGALAAALVALLTIVWRTVFAGFVWG